MKILFSGKPGVARQRAPLQDTPPNFLFELPSIFKKPGRKILIPAEYSYPQQGIANMTDRVCSYQLDIGRKEMIEWLSDCHKGMSGSELESYSCVVYFSSKVVHKETPKLIKALLPVFRDQPNTAEMITHSMGLIQRSTALLSPTQIAVMALDQPLFSLAKAVQITNSCYSMDKIFLILGELHIEQVCYLL